MPAARLTDRTVAFPLYRFGRHTDDPTDLVLAIKGGHNDESHNHNDVGSFLIAVDGIPRVQRLVFTANAQALTAEGTIAMRFETVEHQSAGKAE